jgi:hypothetical protein
VNEKRDAFDSEISPLVDETFETQPTFDDASDALAFAREQDFELDEADFCEMYEQQKAAGMSDQQAMVTTVQALVGEQDGPIRGDLEGQFGIEGVVRKISADGDSMVYAYTLADGSTTTVTQYDSEEPYKADVMATEVDSMLEGEQSVIQAADSDATAVR